MKQSAGGRCLHGLQVFVVEDDHLISMMLEDMLTNFGCVVTGVAATVPRALSMVGAINDIDAAILDVNIGGTMVFPVADALLQRNVRCVFSTGHRALDLIERYPACRRLDKPYAAADLARVLSDLACERPQAG